MTPPKLKMSRTDLEFRYIKEVAAYADASGDLRAHPWIDNKYLLCQCFKIGLAIHVEAWMGGERRRAVYLKPLFALLHCSVTRHYNKMSCIRGKLTTHFVTFIAPT